MRGHAAWPFGPPRIIVSATGSPHGTAAIVWTHPAHPTEEAKHRSRRTCSGRLAVHQGRRPTRMTRGRVREPGRYSRNRATDRWRLFAIARDGQARKSELRVGFGAQG